MKEGNPMKNLFFAISALFTALPSFAATPEAMIAAIRVAKKVLPEINEVRIVTVYRCTNCYQIDIHGRTFSREEFVSVQTKGKDSGKISARITVGSK